VPVLKFKDPISGTWQPLSSAGPAGPPGPAGPIDILTDVDTSTTPPTDKQVLTWDVATGNGSRVRLLLVGHGTSMNFWMLMSQPSPLLQVTS